MAQFVYSMNRVGKVVPPKREILKDISLSFFPGAKIGVLGLNGAGKSTLLKIMAGVDQDYIGEARPMPGINVGYLPQEPELDETKTVREVIEEAVADVKGAMAELDEVYAAYADPDADFDALAKRQGELENLITAKDGHNLDTALERAADAMRLPPWDAEVKHLSGGERRRVALCRLLLDNPDMLLLDEPTNHLDAESIAWIERFLQEYPGTVVAITHDRYFLDNAAGWILELDRGHGIPWEGNYSSWLEQKDERLEQEAKQEAAHQKAIKAELEWVRQGAKGRQSKSKARLKQFEEMNSKEFQTRNETQEIYIPPGPRLGDKVIELNNVTKSYGDKLLFENLNFSIPPGAIVGIIGANGAGKSTLFHLISGRFPLSSGGIQFKGEAIHNLPPYEISRRGLARSFQVTNIFHRMSVFENIRCALLWSEGYRYAFWKLLGRQAELNRKTHEMLEQIGLADKADLPSGELAYAQQRALELGIAVASGAELIMLDEPVAGMSNSEAENAVALIRRITEGKTLIMVEHDLNIVFDIADRISVLVYGEIIATDKPESIRSNARVQEAYLGEVPSDA